MPRVVAHVFQLVQAMASRHVTVKVSYLEVYNETFYDLLNAAAEPQAIQVIEQGASIVLRGLRLATVHSEAEALNLLFDGEKARVVGEHSLNRESSRSHSIFSVIVETREHATSPEVRSTSQ